MILIVRAFHCSTLVVCSALLTLGCQDYDLEEHLYIDEYVQGEDGPVDILWIVDNSGTMSGEQDRLVTGLSGIMALFEETLADFRLGVITTDVENLDHRGKLQGETPVLGPDTPLLSDTFAANASVGSGGSRDEMGIDALELAMTEAIDQGYNDGFFREGAPLDVVVISDEDDQSEGDLGERLAALGSIVPVEDRFRIHAIVGDEPAGCMTMNSSAEAGDRYLEAARSTGGFEGSICLDDWTPLLEQIGLAALGLRRDFVLSVEPRLDTIEVYVNGVAIPERDVDGWSYDPGANAVVFHRYAVPRPGMHVRVQYFRLL